MKYKAIVTTLYEGHYDYGVGALLNSLVSAGFEGLFCIGYKGAVPFWLNQLNEISGETGLYQLTDAVCVRLDLLEPGMHFGYYKPHYLQQMQHEYPGAQSYFYFDPDIVVLAKWEFYETWVKSGVAVCQDIFYQFLHYNHPWRAVWRLDYADFDEGVNTKWNYYINSGFIGVTPQRFDIIDRWVTITGVYKNLGYPIDYFNQGEALSPYKGDQDVLNAVLTLNRSLEIAPLSKDAMGFDFPVAVMAHAVDGGGVKPWKREYIKHALKGKKASVTDEAFLNYCRTPIELYSAKGLNRKRWLLKISKIINRIWKR